MNSFVHLIIDTRMTWRYEMKNFILDILISPNAFFRNAINEKENLKVPLLIVLCVAIIGAVHAYLVGGLTGKLMGALMPGMETIIMFSTVIGAVIGIFLIWIILTGIFYGLSIPFKGQGSFRRCLEFTGYGYLPQILGSVISVIVAFMYAPKVVVPGISAAAIQDPQVIQDAVKTLMHDPAMMEMTQMIAVISIVFLLWSANNWIFGMKYARNLSMRDAAICVGAPVLVYVLYMTYTLAGV
jgi:hypothetical protein